MEKFYYVSLNPLNNGQFVKPYGSDDHFLSFFNFAWDLVAFNDDLIRTMLVCENFIRLIALNQSFPPKRSLEMFVRESIWEIVRREEFSHLPSRIGSVFLWGSYSDALDFRHHYRQGSYIYLCKITGGNVVSADMELITNSSRRFSINETKDFIDDLKNRARKYWALNTTKIMPEYISADPVIVEKAMLAYEYDPRTGELIGQFLPDESPLEKGVFYLPPNCTEIAPPLGLPNQNYRFNGSSWVLSARND